MGEQLSVETLFIILGMGIATFISRFLPMVFLSRWAIPEKVRIGLEYVPAAVLSAIVFPLLFFNGERLCIEPRPIISAIPVFAFALKTKNLWGSVILGMLVYWGLGWVL